MKTIRGVVAFLFLISATSCSLGARQEMPLSYRQGEDAYRLGDFERAARAYRVFIDSEDDDDLMPRAYYKLAASEYRRGQLETSMKVLDELEKQYPREKYPQVFTLRGDIEEGRGNLVSALSWWEQGWAIAEGDEQARIQSRIESTINAMNSASLQAAAGIVNVPEIQEMVQLRQKGGKIPISAVRRPTRQNDEASGAGGDGLPKDDAIPIASPRIGALLPMTGPYATYGLRSLNGLKLALGPDAGLLLVRDTAGDAKTARAVFDELVNLPDVVAVVGPLRSEEAEAVSAVAETASIPTLLLSQREGIKGNSIFQIALTPDTQAAALVDYATRSLNLQRFGLVYPGDAYGNAMAAAFKREAISANAIVVGMQSYPPGARDFSVESLTVQAWREKDGLQALFLPDSAETAGLIAGEIKRLVPQIVLLGGNAWHDLGKLAESSLALQGGVFSDGFFEGSSRPESRSFLNAYQSAYQSTPGILEAQAYDAGRLLHRVMAQGGRSRGAITGQLKSLGAVEGVSGRMNFSPHGVTREVFLLKLDHGVLRELGDADRAPLRPAANR